MVTKSSFVQLQEWQFTQVLLLESNNLEPRKCPGKKLVSVSTAIM